ncbi:MAG TPA: hypothetical protein VJM47_02185, partial [Nitrosospira sp.]|nr:hypothetical protein [Nitrosospira sp.]
MIQRLSPRDYNHRTRLPEGSEGDDGRSRFEPIDTSLQKAQAAFREVVLLQHVLIILFPAGGIYW